MVEEPYHLGEVPQEPVQMQAEGPLAVEVQEEDMPLGGARAAGGPV